MKQLWIIPLLIISSITPALAGASSENRLDPKALEGPEGKGAKSTDPNIERQGSPGPAGPSDSTSAPSNKSSGSQFNDYGKGTSGSGSTGAGSGESGTSGATSGGSSSGSGMPHPGPDSNKLPPNSGSSQ